MRLLNAVSAACETSPRLALPPCPQREGAVVAAFALGGMAGAGGLWLPGDADGLAMDGFAAAVDSLALSSSCNSFGMLGGGGLPPHVLPLAGGWTADLALGPTVGADAFASCVKSLGPTIKCLPLCGAGGVDADAAFGWMAVAAGGLSLDDDDGVACVACGMSTSTDPDLTSEGGAFTGGVLSLRQ